MSEAKQCPHCGASLDNADHDTQSDAPSPAIETEALTQASSGDDLPAFALLAPGSNDDTFLSTPYGRKVEPAEPDPILGQFVANGSTAEPSLPVDQLAPSPQKPPKSASANFPAINFDASSTRPTTPQSPVVEEEEEEEEEEVSERRNGWSGVLIASYASAVTLALAWFVVQDRSRARPLPSEPPRSENLVPPARQRELSRIVQPPEPIIGEHMARFGQTIVVGSLAITPIDVKRQDVKLQRATVLSVPELRDGGKKALVLRLKIKNTSKNLVFAPLDQTYLRETANQQVDSYVTTRDDERVYPYPLAVESEWSIVGQDFRELRPGESRTISIATAADAPPDDAGPFTWRIRLRTGIDRTDVIGVVWPKPAEN